MKAQKVRNLLFVAVFAVMLVVSNVAPAAAHTLTPMPLGCSFQGNYYPLGTVLRIRLPGTDHPIAFLVTTSVPVEKIDSI